LLKALAVLGRVRSSSTSTDKVRADLFTGVAPQARAARGNVSVRFRSQDEKNMVIRVLDEVGLRWNERAIATGAQTERRGEVGPVRDSLGGKTSPAAKFDPPMVQVNTPETVNRLQGPIGR
jgi:hypothetical protein